jgi:aspartate-semialdehyde dehydrogenase
MKKYKIAVVGATGNVGREIINVLKDRNFPAEAIYPLTSSRSAGKKLSFGRQVLTALDVASFDFSKVQIAMFAIPSVISREYRERVVSAGCIMIDNSSGFRMEEGVPLVVADVNLEEVANYKEKMVLSNANCSVSPMIMVLKALEEYGIKRVVASTYQSVSGAGKHAMDELYSSTKAFYEISISGKEVTDRPEGRIFTKDIAFNCIPRIDRFMEDGRTKEEWKMEEETRKILKNPNIKVASTCVRVPIFVGHSVAVAVEFEKPFEIENIREKITDKEGIVVMDGMEDGRYVTPRDVARTTGVFVSRIRRDSTVPSGLLFWSVADNVYGIGAAYNSVRIAEELTKYI